MAVQDKLSAVLIKNAKPKEKPYKLADGRGLNLLVNPNGSKYWRLSYRLAGKQKTLALGVYPEVALAAVRIAVVDARKLIKQGIDPLSHRRHEAARLGESSFKAVALEWHKKEAGRWSSDHAQRVLDSIKADVLPVIGGMPIEKIEARHCLTVIRNIEERGALDVAGRAKQRMAAVFRYAIYTGLTTHNPVDALKDVIQSHKVVHRQALSADELPDFLRDLDVYSGGALTKLGLKLLLHTFVRPGELRAATWNEFDIERKEWRIPAERMKMREEHIVPLTDQAIAVLTELRTISGQYDFVFPGIRDWRKPMSENTLTFAIRKRMGYDATAHGFRTVASTIFNETGFRSDVIERQLAHSERNKVRAAYNRSQYLAERREMMKWWSDYLDTLKSSGVVIPIGTGYKKIIKAE